MKTATLIAEHPVWPPEPGRVQHAKRHFRLSEPLDGADFVYVSAVTLFGEPETYIFACSEEGKVTDWVELTGSQKGTTDIDQVLLDAGYTVVR